ncbi:MAG: hypothetical protein BRC30_01145 [Nanohaloarchaea archaeon SW_7_46_7]|nr:MAG: hypothetical protein BRC30_01145 [Nanohaloarchaea archaeon SW_7_46_7]
MDKEMLPEFQLSSCWRKNLARNFNPDTSEVKCGWDETGITDLFYPNISFQGPRGWRNNPRLCLEEALDQPNTDRYLG